MSDSLPTVAELELRYARQLQGVPFECGPGWNGLLKTMFDAIEEGQASGEVPADFTWDQIKEKWGSLHMYHPPKEPLCDLLDELEELSLKTCELCGQPGELLEKGWRTVRCAEHRDER